MSLWIAIIIQRAIQNIDLPLRVYQHVLRSIKTTFLYIILTRSVSSQPAKPAHSSEACQNLTGPGRGRKHALQVA